MTWLQGIPLIGQVIKTIWGDQEARDKFQSDHRTSVYQQFAAEFGHSKTWWDSLIDGFNRLPRPFMTFGTIYIFWICWADPAAFIEGATALQAMPKEGWYILGAVVTFWFAAKLPKDFGKYKAPDIVQIKETLSEPVHQAQKGEDPQEGIEWINRVDTRYKTDWDNLNN